MSIKEELKEIESNPTLQRKLKAARIVILIDYVLWIGSILVLIYQFNTNNNSNVLNTIWGVMLIGAIVLGIVGRSMKRKAYRKALLDK